MRYYKAVVTVAVDNDLQDTHSGFLDIEIVKETLERVVQLDLDSEDGNQVDEDGNFIQSVVLDWETLKEVDGDR